MSIVNKINSLILSDEKFINKIRYNKEGYFIYKRPSQIDFKVTIILPVYNAEKTVVRTIDSIIDQTIGFEHIHLLIVDDQSTDSSKLILMNYAKKYSNITLIFLEENTGSPAIPRNLGIKYATGKYVCFIDSDDWLEKEGIEILYNLLESTGDNYAVGKTIKVSDKGQHIIGEYNSCLNRNSIEPMCVERIFYHLGPTGRMIRTSFLREHSIVFPNMKYAEDKRFFIDVLINCDGISTTKKVVYYANRYSENKSLTSTTSIFEKTEANISVIKYVINKNLPIPIEKRILNRLYEFDCITRLFDRQHFLKSKEKEKYFEKFSEVLNTTKSLRYDFTENFYKGWHKVLINLFNEGKFKEIVTLIKWHRHESIKEYFVKDNVPYFKLPFSGVNGSSKIRMIATHKLTLREKDGIILHIEAFGKYVNEINSLVIRSRNNDLSEVEFPTTQIDNNLFKVVISYEKISSLKSGSHAMYLKYFNYEKVFIRMNTRKIIEYNGRNLDFYTTIGDNYGFKIY